MPEKKVAEKIRKETEKMARSGILTKLMSLVPGYHGYKNKEIRREADKILRNYMVKKLNDIKGMLDRLQQMLVDYNLTQTWETMDRIMARFDLIRSKVDHADYGYSGFFDAIKIKEEQLDRMYEFDANMLDKIGELERFVKAFQDEMDAAHFDKAWEYVYKLLRMLDDFLRIWEERKNYMLKFTE